jgi:F0F1-type ATP synthase membrane subunit b/b'
LVLFFLNLYLVLSIRALKNKQNYTSIRFSEEVINQAANEIKKEAKNILFDINKKLFDFLTSFYKKEVINFTEAWNGAMMKFKDSIEKELPEISKIKLEMQERILIEVEKQIKDLAKDISKKTEKIYESAAQLINQEIIESEKYIKNYKNKKIKEIDEKAYQIINDLAKRLIGRSLTVSEQENLIIKSLEEAKKELL